MHLYVRIYRKHKSSTKSVFSINSVFKNWESVFPSREFPTQNINLKIKSINLESKIKNLNVLTVIGITFTLYSNK